MHPFLKLVCGHDQDHGVSSIYFGLIRQFSEFPTSNTLAEINREAVFDQLCQIMHPNNKTLLH